MPVSASRCWPTWPIVRPDARMIWPRSGSSCFSSRRKSVVFPAPLRPTRPTCSPGLCCHVTPRSTSCGPYDFSMLSKRYSMRSLSTTKRSKVFRDARCHPERERGIWVVERAAPRRPSVRRLAHAWGDSVPLPQIIDDVEIRFGCEVRVRVRASVRGNRGGTRVENPRRHLLSERGDVLAISGGEINALDRVVRKSFDVETFAVAAESRGVVVNIDAGKRARRSAGNRIEQIAFARILRSHIH